MSALAQIGSEVDPLLAPHAVEDPGPGRFEERLGHVPERAFVVEAIYEGYLMHYREPRAFSGVDPDLRLLAGDALYALGLERLAQSGDLEAVAELADLISACAQAEAEGRADAAEALWAESVERLARTA